MIDHSVRDLSNSPMLGLRIGPNKEQSPLNNIKIITGAFYILKIRIIGNIVAIELKLIKL